MWFLCRAFLLSALQNYGSHPFDQKDKWAEFHRSQGGLWADGTNFGQQKSGRSSMEFWLWDLQVRNSWIHKHDRSSFGSVFLFSHRDKRIHSTNMYSVTAMDGLQIRSWSSLGFIQTQGVERTGWVSWFGEIHHNKGSRSIVTTHLVSQICSLSMHYLLWVLLALWCVREEWPWAAAIIVMVV